MDRIPSNDPIIENMFQSEERLVAESLQRATLVSERLALIIKEKIEPDCYIGSSRYKVSVDGLLCEIDDSAGTVGPLYKCQNCKATNIHPIHEARDIKHFQINLISNLITCQKCQAVLIYSRPDIE